MWGALRRAFQRIGFDPTDDADLRLRKRVLVAIAAMIAPAAMLWGGTYLAFDEPLAGSIPLFYAAASTASLTAFAITRRYRAFRTTQLALILILPFLLQLALGGFVNASAVILWSLLAPLGAMLISGRRQAVLWFAAYAALVVVAQLVQPSVRLDNNLTTATVLVFFGMNVVGVSAIAFTLLHYFVGQRDAAFGMLEAEQAKSEGLLLNILPRQVAAVLKDEHRTIAESYPAISVLFADVVGFTPMSQRLDPQAMVTLLNDVFSHFDRLAARHGCEKIRTIGDNYMVACGVPASRPDHAQALARMALGMRDRAADPTLGIGALQFRLGMNSGPAVAGIIGTTKFQYDVWGDTVNTASRMESQGVPGRIQITRATYELLGDGFVCQPRGVVDVKGKGTMETWFLERER